MTDGYNEILYAFELQSNYAITMEEAQSVNIVSDISIRNKLKDKIQETLDEKELEMLFGRIFPTPIISKIQISSIFLGDLYFDANLKTHSFKEGKYFVLPKGTLLNGTMHLEKELNGRLVKQIKGSFEEIDTIRIRAKDDFQLLKCKASILSLSPALKSINQEKNVPEIINKKGEVQIENIQLKESKSPYQEKQQIKTAIAKNDILKALNLMAIFTNKAKKEYENDVILFKTTFNQIEMDVLRGQLGKDEEYAFKNRLVNRILKLTDLIFD